MADKNISQSGKLLWKATPDDIGTPRDLTGRFLGVMRVEGQLPAATSTITTDAFQDLTIRPDGQLILDARTELSVGSSIVGEANTNLVSWLNTGPADPVWPNKIFESIGDPNEFVNIDATVFNPVRLKNDTAIQGFNAAYNATFNMLSPGIDDYVIVGDGGTTITAIRAEAPAQYPVVREGAFGSTTDWVIWHEGNLTAGADLADTGLQTFVGSITINGDLTVLGNTDIVQREISTGENAIVLNADWPDATPPTEDGGLFVYRGNTGDVTTGIVWDETADKWVFQQRSGVDPSYPTFPADGSGGTIVSEYEIWNSNNFTPDDKADKVIQIIAGAGLGGSGTLATDTTLAIGAGPGITVNAATIQLDETYAGTLYAPLVHTHVMTDITDADWIAHLIEDLTPQLGGGLDVNGHAITGASGVNISSASDLTLQGQIFPAAQGNVGDVMIATGANTSPWARQNSVNTDYNNATSGLTATTVQQAIDEIILNNPTNALFNIVEDITPQLGGNLDVNGQDIVSIAGIDINIAPGTGGIIVFGSGEAGTLASEAGQDLILTPGIGGALILDGITWPVADGTLNQVIYTDGTGQLSWADNVSSVYGRTGPVIAQAGDYTGLLITYSNVVSGLTAVTTQAAIDELAANAVAIDALQPFRADVTYTVDASGGTPGTYDFDSFDEAVEYVSTRNMSSGPTVLDLDDDTLRMPRITLFLQDGTHPAASGFYKLENLNIELQITSNGPGLATLGANGDDIFIVDCYDVRIDDISLDGNWDVKNSNVLLGELATVNMPTASLTVRSNAAVETFGLSVQSMFIRGGKLTGYSPITIGIGGLQLFDGAKVFATDMIFDGDTINNMQGKLTLQTSSYLYADNISIINQSGAGTWLAGTSSTSQLRLVNAPSLGLMTGFSLIPENEIQLDGSAIWNGATGVSLSGTAYLVTGSSVDDLSDVDTTTVAPSTGDTLEFDGTNFVPLVRVASVAGKTGAVILVKSDISDFSDGDYATAAQGLLADSALQDITAESVGDLNDVDTTTVAPTLNQYLAWDGSNFIPTAPGTAPVDSIFSRTGIVVAEVGDYAAFYATTAQGTLADSALQDITAESVGDLNDVDITTVAPTIGQVIAWDGSNFIPTAQGAAPVDSVFGRTGVVTGLVGDYAAFYATTAQGILADSALQTSDNVSELSNDAGYLTANAVDSVAGKTGVVTLVIDDMTDVDTTTVAPTLGQTLEWDGSNFVPATPGSGAVDSVFTRTGAVVAEVGDYAAFYATTAQGTLADSAVQSGDNISVLVNDSGYITSNAVDSVAGKTGVVTLVKADITDFSDGDYATAAQGATADSALQDVIEDTTPQLGGQLDTNGFAISSSTFVQITSNAGTSGSPIAIEPGNGSSSLGGIIRLRPGKSSADISAAVEIITATGATASVPVQFGEANANGNDYITLKAPDSITTTRQWTLPQDDPATAAGQFLTTDASGILSFATALVNVVEDLTPELGGDLDVNGQEIISQAAVDIVLTPGSGANVVLASDAGLYDPIVRQGTGPTTDYKIIHEGNLDTVSIDALSDVDTSTTTPNVNENLTWDGTNWIPEADLGWSAPLVNTGWSFTAGTGLNGYRVVGKVVHVAIETDTTAGVTGTSTIFTLPAAYRPATGDRYFVGEDQSGNMRGVTITTAGSVIGNNLTASAGLKFYASFII